MADPVTDAVNDVKAKITAGVSGVTSRTVYLYDLDDILDATRKLKFPSIGIVYMGMQGMADTSKTGLAADLMLDILVAGGEQCNDKVSDLKVGTTDLLNQVRNALKCTELDRVGAKRKWWFVLEGPLSLRSDEADLVLYRQRWKTKVLLTND